MAYLDKLIIREQYHLPESQRRKTRVGIPNAHDRKDHFEGLIHIKTGQHGGDTIPKTTMPEFESMTSVPFRRCAYQHTLAWVTVDKLWATEGYCFSCENWTHEGALAGFCCECNRWHNSYAEHLTEAEKNYDGPYWWCLRCCNCIDRSDPDFVDIPIPPKGQPYADPTAGDYSLLAESKKKARRSN